jgi:hypothetical protein
MAYREIILADRPSNYWRLNEPSGTSAVDLVAGANGTISGGVTLNQPGALADGDKAMAFNGTDGKIQTVASVAIPLVCTIELWVKILSGSAGRVMIDSRSIGAGNTVVLYITDATGTVTIASAVGTVTTTRGVTDGAWHHLVCVLTGTTGRWYLDGTPDLPVLLARSTPGTGPISFACDQVTAGEWPGSLDEVAIYPSALTPAQILAHYQARALPFLPGTYPYQVVQDGASNFWRLNEPSGTTAVDLVGGATGTISGGVTLNQPGALADGDKAMTFDGTTGKIQTTSITIPLVATIEAWFKLGAVAVYQSLVSTRTVSSGSTLAITINPGNGKIEVYGKTPTATLVSGRSSLTDNVWHHLMLVTNGTSASLYLDGAPDSVGIAFVRSTPSVGPALFASDIDGSPLFWTGSLDEVAIYPVALTPAQIAAHYTARLWAPTLAAPVVIEDGEDDDEAALRLREFHGSVSGSARVLATDSGVLPLVPASAKQSVFLQEIHVEVTALGAGASWTVQDGAGVPLVPAIPATALAHQDFYFGANGVPCSEATALALAVTGGAAGSVTWEGYRRLTGTLTLAPFTPRYSDLVRADGASNYWRLNETSGLTAVDGIGGVNGTISGGVTLTARGARGGRPAMTFNGVDGKIALNAQRTLVTPLSVEAWIKTTASSGFQAWWSTRNPATVGAQLIEVDIGNGAGVHTNLTGGAPTDISSSRIGLNDGLWHHIVWIQNGTTMWLYIDGVLDTTSAQSYPAPVGLKTETIGADTVLSRFFNGSLDDVAIYPVALTPRRSPRTTRSVGRAVPV